MPYRVDGGALERTRNRRVKFMHCLPAFHDDRTEVGRRGEEQTAISGGLEVTLHTIKAVLVATIDVE